MYTSPGTGRTGSYRPVRPQSAHCHHLRALLYFYRTRLLLTPISRCVSGTPTRVQRPTTTKRRHITPLSTQSPQPEPPRLVHHGSLVFTSDVPELVLVAGLPHRIGGTLYPVGEGTKLANGNLCVNFSNALSRSKVSKLHCVLFSKNKERRTYVFSLDTAL